MARTEAISLARLDDFVLLPWKVRAKDPLWVPPLRQVEKLELSSPRVAKELFLHGDEGRIAALVHPALPFGQLGYFEAANEEAARSLIDAASAWLRARGLSRAVGPMNGGAHRLHRFLVSGFERAPFLFEPRNPPEYPRWFESAGFTRAHTWWTYEAPRAWVERIRKLLEPGVVRAVKTGHRAVPLVGEAGIDRLHALLDLCWKGHVGYASLDAAELREVFAGAFALMNERSVGVVHDAAGRDQGFSFMFPDWVDEARALQGDASGWGRWLAKPLPKRVICHTIAFKPEARRTGAPFLIADHGMEHLLQDGYEEVVFALVTEEWRLLGRALEATREYALYERSI
jgi:hypothetical protein